MQGVIATRGWHHRRMTIAPLSLFLAAALVLAPSSQTIAAPVAHQDHARVLVFSKTAKFRHDSIPVAVETLVRVAHEQGMQADASEDAGVFEAGRLAGYRAVVFANTTGDVLDEAQQQALQDFIRGGGGFVGVHSAADTEHGWPWYGELVGAWFHKHPPGLQSTVIRPERDGRRSGASWPIRDEIYNYKRNPRPHVEVTATVDPGMYEGGTMGEDHPIAWCRAFDGGRTWYTGLGHDASVYADPHFLAQLRQGLRYATGLSPDC